jgi:hypothetical protein
VRLVVSLLLLLLLILKVPTVRMADLLWRAYGVLHSLLMHPPLFLLDMQHYDDGFFTDESAVKFYNCSLGLFRRFVRPVKSRLKIVQCDERGVSDGF